MYLDPPEENIDHSIEAIFVGNCSWEEVENHCEATKNYRLNKIYSAKHTSDILNKWPQYKKPLGFKLINFFDFAHLYPKAECFRTNFVTSSLKIDSVFEDRIKDQANKLLFQNMRNMQSISENGRCIAIFYLLHSILVPSTKIFKVTNGKKICTRFSIRDSQKSFIIDGNTVAVCEEELLSKFEQKVNIQPIILISGSILELKEHVINFEEI